MYKTCFRLLMNNIKLLLEILLALSAVSVFNLIGTTYNMF